MGRGPASSTTKTAARRSPPRQDPGRRAARPRRPSAHRSRPVGRVVGDGSAQRASGREPADQPRRPGPGCRSTRSAIRKARSSARQTTTFDGTRVAQTWEPADGPAQTASWEAEPPSGDVHLANAGIGAPGGLGTAGSLAADSLTATAKAIAGDMLALGASASAWLAPQ